MCKRGYYPFNIASGNLHHETTKSGEEMWVEVTVPAQGPPRLIRNAIKKDDVLTPLKLN